MKLRKILSYCLCLCFLFACQKTTVSTEKKTIYTSFFPIYDLTKRIVGEKMDVKMIIQNNEEPHSYELKSSTMVALKKSDLIVYNGAGMETFIADLKNTMQEDKFLDLSSGLALLTTSKEDKKSVNPHTWLSIRNAIKQLETLKDKVCEIDSNNSAYYQSNYEKAIAEFKSLDQKFVDELNKVKRKEKYFVVSHAAFNYLAHDYGLKQVAVTGISPEEEPTAKQLKKIADFVHEKQIKTIFFEGKATPKVALTLAKNAGVKTDSIYTMENVTTEEMQQGYLKLMELNLLALVRAFNE